MTGLDEGTKIVLDASKWTEATTAETISEEDGRTNYELMFAAGDSAIGDLRGGDFYWVRGDTTPPVLGKVLASTGGRWFRKPIHEDVVRAVDLTLNWRRGAFDGERIYIWTYYDQNNPGTGQNGTGDCGGGRWLVWDEDSTDTPDGGRVFGMASMVSNIYTPTPGQPAGRWIDNRSLTVGFSVADYGCPLTSYHASALGAQYRTATDAIQSAMNNARPYRGRVTVPEGAYNIDKPLYTPATHQDFLLEADGKAIWYWTGGLTYESPTGGAEVGPGGAGGSVMLLVRGAGCTVKGLTYRGFNTLDIVCPFSAGYGPDETPGSLTGIRFIECGVEGLSATPGAGTVDYGFALDYFQMQSGNCENITFQECVASRVRYSCAWIRNTIQPFNVRFDRCQFYGLLNTINAQNPYGIGILNDASSCTLRAVNCEFQRLSIWYYGRQYAYSVTFDDCSGEQVKKVIYHDGVGATQSIGTVQIIGGRVNSAGFVLEGQGELIDGLATVADFAANPGATATTTATDVQYIMMTGTHSLIIDGFVFNDGYAEQPGKIGVFDNNIISRGNKYPNANPFIRNSSYGIATNRGRTYSQGDTAQNGASNQIALPTLYGAENGAGQATISGANTFVDVDFTTNGGVDEVSAAYDYKVDLTIASISGAAVVTTPYISNRTEAGFRINVPAAPGVGTSVTFDYKPYR